MSRTGEERIGISGFLTKTPGIGGVLRMYPEDFIVDEVLPPGMLERGEGGSHTILRVRAVNRETNEMLAEIARALHVGRGRVRAAGMKDKRAVTTQYISVSLPPSKVNLSLRGIEVLEKYPSDSHLRLGSSSGNRFRVRVHRVSPDADRVVDRCREEILAAGGVPNFYGPQRFGTLRPVTALVGKAMTRRDFQAAVELYLSHPGEDEPEDVRAARREPDLKERLRTLPRWCRYERAMIHRLLERPDDHVYALHALPRGLLMMFVHAYQSYIFNRIVSERLARGIPLNIPQVGDIVHVGTGEMVPVRETNLEKIRRLAGEGRASVTGLVFGSRPEFAEGVMGEIERAEVEREGVAAGDFIIPEVRCASSSGTRRDIIARLDDIRIDHVSEEMVSFGFELGPGRYATCVLREFMKTHMRHY